MKTALRIAAALAVVALATPALACSEQKTTSASTEKSDATKNQTSTAKAEKQAAVKTSSATR
jgi:hypothetical protein